MSLVALAMELRLLRKPVLVDGRQIGFARTTGEVVTLLRMTGRAHLTVNINRHLSEGPTAFFVNSGRTP